MIKELLIASLVVSTFSGAFATSVQAEEAKSSYAVGSFAAVTAYAKEKDLDRYLEKSGYPQELIGSFDVEQKQRIFDAKAVYASHQKQDGILNETGVSQIQSANGLENYQPEQMNNFTQTLTASKVATPSAYGKIEYILDYNWTWNQSAYINLRDKFGISWTDDFDADPNSAVYAYRAFGRSMYTYVEGEYWTGNKYNQIEKYTNAGIGWEYDIIDSWMDSRYTYTVYKHKGWGQVKISKWSNNTGLNEQTSAVAAYFHKQGATTASFSFSGVLPSVGLDVTDGYDKTDDVAANPFTWNNYKYQ